MPFLSFYMTFYFPFHSLVPTRPTSIDQGSKEARNRQLRNFEHWTHPSQRNHRFARTQDLFIYAH
jgi:hypothetical protein